MDEYDDMDDDEYDTTGVIEISKLDAVVRVWMCKVVEDNCTNKQKEELPPPTLVVVVAVVVVVVVGIIQQRNQVKNDTNKQWRIPTN